jgi:hypothetical protein
LAKLADNGGSGRRAAEDVRMIDSILSTAACGMTTAASGAEQVALRVADPAQGLRSIERDTVTLAGSSVAYRANAAVARTADQLLGTLLDTFV